MGQPHLARVGLRRRDVAWVQRLHLEPSGHRRGVHHRRVVPDGRPPVPDAVHVGSPPASAPVPGVLPVRHLPLQPPDPHRRGHGPGGHRADGRPSRGARLPARQRADLDPRPRPPRDGQDQHVRGEPLPAAHLQRRGHPLRHRLRHRGGDDGRPGQPAAHRAAGVAQLRGGRASLLLHARGLQHEPALELGLSPDAQGLRPRPDSRPVREDHARPQPRAAHHLLPGGEGGVQLGQHPVGHLAPRLPQEDAPARARLARRPPCLLFLSRLPAHVPAQRRHGQAVARAGQGLLHLLPRLHRPRSGLWPRPARRPAPNRPRLSGASHPHRHRPCRRRRPQPLPTVGSARSRQQPLPHSQGRGGHQPFHRRAAPRLRPLLEGARGRCRPAAARARHPREGPSARTPPGRRLGDPRRSHPRPLGGQRAARPLLRLLVRARHVRARHGHVGGRGPQGQGWHAALPVDGPAHGPLRGHGSRPVLPHLHDLLRELHPAPAPQESQV